MRKSSLKLLGLVLCSYLSLASTTFSVSLKQIHSNPNQNLKNSHKDGIDADLTNYYNSQYTGSMIIGSNNQSFNLIFDTSSPWIWVLNSTTNAPKMSSKFNCILSLTCRYATQSSGDFIKGEYFAFSKNVNVEGIMASDYISFPNSRVVNQSFLIMNEEHADLLAGVSIDGVCGLSLRNGNKSPTLLKHLKKTGLIEREIFSLYLHSNPEAYEEEGSEILFGGINPNKKIGNFVNVTVDDSPYWEAKLTNIFMIAGNTSSEINKNASRVVFDSGIHTLKMPKVDFILLTKSLKQDFGLSCSYLAFAKNTYSCNCEDGNIKAFPNITFVIGTTVLTIPPSQYLMIKKNNCILLIDSFTVLETTQGNYEEKEDLSNKPNGDPENYIVLGTPFFRSYYSVFDADNMTISFAQPVKQKKQLVTSLELVYLIFGIFIFILFCSLVVCTVRIWTNKNENTKKESVNFDHIITDRSASGASYRPIN